MDHQSLKKEHYLSQKVYVLYSIGKIECPVSTAKPMLSQKHASKIYQRFENYGTEKDTGGGGVEYTFYINIYI